MSDETTTPEEPIVEAPPEPPDGTGRAADRRGGRISRGPRCHQARTGRVHRAVGYGRGDAARPRGVPAGRLRRGRSGQGPSPDGSPGPAHRQGRQPRGANRRSLHGLQGLAHRTRGRSDGPCHRRRVGRCLGRLPRSPRWHNHRDQEWATGTSPSESRSPRGIHHLAASLRAGGCHLCSLEGR